MVILSVSIIFIGLRGDIKMSNRKILRDNSITDIVHLMDGKEPRQNPEGQREIFFYRFIHREIQERVSQGEILLCPW